MAADIAADTPGGYPALPSFAAPTTAPRFQLPPETQVGKVQVDGAQEDVYVLPNGRLLTPAGQQLQLGNFPQGIALHPSGKVAYISSGGKGKAIQVVDLAAQKVVQELKKPFVYRWLAISPDAKYLYASGGPKMAAWRFAMGADGTLADDKTYTTDYGFFGIALSPDGKYLYGLVDSGKLSGDTGKPRPQLWRLDVQTGQPDAAADLADAPYDLAIAPDGKTAWLTTWRGGKVQRVDLGEMASPGAAQTVALGYNGQGIALTPDGKTAFATSVEGDFVMAIDTASMAVKKTISLNFSDIVGMAPQGRDPGFLQVSPDGQRVYVVCALSNEVMVLDAVALKVIGTIPVGWYPSGVAVSADSKQLYVVNAKGNGYPPGPWKSSGATSGYMGTLATIAVPEAATLAANQKLVLDNLLGVTGKGRVPVSAPVQKLIPLSGGSQEISHVIYLVRENKTFDVELGDLAGEVTGVTADPSLALFGEEYTPNLHKLAKQFCLLDNFYTDGDYSALGHSYITAGKASDYIEKFYALKDTGATEMAWGVGPASSPGRGFFFQNILAHGLTVASYGEIVGMTDTWAKVNILQTKYPGMIFNLGVLDIDKATWFTDHIKAIDLPHFAVISVPNNHTCCGGDPNHLSPKSMVADNDEATGVVIEALTHHKDWKSTVVFILEDDPQDGGDSVAYHRSPMIVVSPWAQHGHVNHVHHAIGAMHATMEQILDVTPLTELDALAGPIYGCFATTPDPTPYSHIARIYPPTQNKDEVKKKWTKAMTRQWRDYGPNVIDGKPGLGRLLWHMYKGSPAPWPEQRFDPPGREDDDD